MSGPGRGFHVPHAQDPAGVGAASIPGWRCSHDRQNASGRRLPLHNGQPCTPVQQSIHPGLTLTRRFGGSLAFTRPAFPSPTALGWIEVASASSLSFAPHRYRRRTSERGRAIEHLPGLRHQRHRRPPTQRATCTCDFVSHHLRGASREQVDSTSQSTSSLLRRAPRSTPRSHHPTPSVDQGSDRNYTLDCEEPDCVGPAARRLGPHAPASHRDHHGVAAGAVRGRGPGPAHGRPASPQDAVSRAAGRGRPRRRAVRGRGWMRGTGASG